MKFVLHMLLMVGLVVLTQSVSAYTLQLVVPSYATLETRIAGREVSLSSDAPLITTAEGSLSFADLHSPFQFYAVRRDLAAELALWSIVCHVHPLSEPVFETGCY
jgi:hypothetical protein